MSISKRAGLNTAIWAVMAMMLVGVMTAGGAPAVAQSGPQLGAQIWIEPGQTPAEIDAWFAQLESSHMPVARLFMMWTYLEIAPDQWDFSLYDAAFRAAEKHHVHIVATLTPNGPPLFRGGDGSQGRDILKTSKDVTAASAYLQKVVERYRSSPALDTWLLVNEPGQKPTVTPNAVAAFRLWAAKEYGTTDRMNATWGTVFPTFDAVEPPTEEKSWNHNRELDWRTFWQGFQTDQLRWLAEQVRALDGKHPLHLNPAGITGNLADSSDDLPAWRSFLDTLGCSIHPSWHFALFDRDRYGLAVSYTNDLVRGSIEPKPYWVTELQGGNTIYSGTVALEPTAADTAQWTWTSLAAGARRVIFWLLNARREGVEAGEWSLLDFAQHPSERLTTAANIAKVVDENAAFFSAAKPVASPVTLVLSLQTMTFEEVYHREDDPAYRRKDDPARGSNAHFLEAMGFYEALSRLGSPPNVKLFDDYDWAAITPTRRVAILPDIREMTEPQIRALNAFVEHGNLLLISGLSGFYGAHAKAWALDGFPLGDVTGGLLKEVHLRGISPTVALGEGAPLPSRLWTGTITPGVAQSISKKDGEVVATERSLPGGGRVIWVPSLIGLGAWLTDGQPLTRYLQHDILSKVDVPAFSFAQAVDGCLVRVLHEGGSYITVVTNGKASPVSCTLKSPTALRPSALWGTSPKTVQRGLVSIPLQPRGTSVLIWR
jgi:beta-galactosidase